MKKRLLLLTSSLLIISTVSAQTPAHLTVRQYRQTHEHALLTEFMGLLSLPNVVLQQPADSIRLNARRVAQMMEQRGIRPQLLELDAKTPPVVFGEVTVPGATQTLIFYAHYDGQAVQPAKWATGTAPFRPVLATNSIENGGKIVPMPAPGQSINPDYRVIARSATDDKAGIFTILAGYGALLESGLKPTVNLKFFFEGEEEVGSAHLGDYLEKYKSLLTSDLWVFVDGPVHQSGRKQVVFGCRGDVNMELTVYGSRRPLHSGHYGNWVPNPAQNLARLLASMKDETGRVLVKGFYDDVTPPSASEKQVLAAVPMIDDDIRTELGFARPDGAGQSLAQLINQPSLNINGMVSAGVGAQGANVIPATATALLDLRLVLGNDHQRQTQRVADHIRAQGYLVLDREPTPTERLASPLIAKVLAKSGYNAQRTPLDLPIARRVVAAVQQTMPEPVVLMPSLGGTLPLYLFEKILKTNALLTVPVANYDSNQHGENENIRIQNLWDGIESVGSMMMMGGK